MNIAPATPAAVPDAAAQQRYARASSAAHKFESFFVYQFLDLSSPPVDPKDTFSGGFGAQMFRHQMNEQVADQLEAKGGFGLADGILKQMAARGEIPAQPPHPAAAAASYRHIQQGEP
jgi:Rod binding domain-containing protein